MPASIVAGSLQAHRELGARVEVAVTRHYGEPDPYDSVSRLNEEKGLLGGKDAKRPHQT